MQTLRQLCPRLAPRLLWVGFILAAFSVGCDRTIEISNTCQDADYSWDSPVIDGRLEPLAAGCPAAGLGQCTQPVGAKFWFAPGETLRAKWMKLDVTLKNCDSGQSNRCNYCVRQCLPPGVDELRDSDPKLWPPQIPVTVLEDQYGTTGRVAATFDPCVAQPTAPFTTSSGAPGTTKFRLFAPSTSLVNVTTGNLVPIPPSGETATLDAVFVPPGGRVYGGQMTPSTCVVTTDPKKVYYTFLADPQADNFSPTLRATRVRVGRSSPTSGPALYPVVPYRIVARPGANPADCTSLLSRDELRCYSAAGLPPNYSSGLGYDGEIDLQRHCYDPPGHRFNPLEATPTFSNAGPAVPVVWVAEFITYDRNNPDARDPTGLFRPPHQADTAHINFTVEAAADVSSPARRVDWRPVGLLESYRTLSGGGDRPSLYGLISGWAVDCEDTSPIIQVEVFLDGQPLPGQLLTGLARPDLTGLLPCGDPNTAGWTLRVPPLAQRVGTRRSLTAIVRDSAGNATLLGPLAW